MGTGSVKAAEVTTAMKTRHPCTSAPLFIPLESIRVASPCDADWNAMHGDDRARFCPSCAKNVYNLSALTKVEAEALLLEKEGKLCVRYFQRPDGTLLTQDCPIGLLRADTRLQPSFAFWANATALAMLVAALLTGSLSPTALQAQPYENGGQSALPTATPSPIPTPSPVPTPADTHLLRAEMGDVAVGTEMQGSVAPRPAPPFLLGEVQAQPTPTPTPQALMGAVKQPDPPVIAATMGKPALALCAKPPQPPTGAVVGTSSATVGQPTHVVSRGPKTKNASQKSKAHRHAG